MAVKTISGKTKAAIKRVNAKYINHNELYTLPLFSDEHLLAYWRFESSSADETPNNNNGTDTAMLYAGFAGKFNNGAYFQNISRIVFPTRIINTGPGSIGFWASKSVASYATLISIGTGWDGDNAGIYVWLDTNTNKMQFQHRSGVNNGQNYCSDDAVFAGTGWQHYVHTFTGDTSPNGHKLYKNGVLVKQATPTFSDPPPSGTRTVLGSARHDSALYGFTDGIMDELFMMSRVLTAEEVSDLYGKQVKKFMGVNITGYSKPVFGP